MAQSLRDFTTLMKKYKSKTKTSREKLSENGQLLEDLIERFEERQRKVEADTQKRQSDIKNEK